MALFRACVCRAPAHTNHWHHHGPMPTSPTGLHPPTKRKAPYRPAGTRPPARLHAHGGACGRACNRMIGPGRQPVAGHGPRPSAMWCHGLSAMCLCQAAHLRCPQEVGAHSSSQASCSGTKCTCLMLVAQEAWLIALRPLASIERTAAHTAHTESSSRCTSASEQ